MTPNEPTTIIELLQLEDVFSMVKHENRWMAWDAYELVWKIYEKPFRKHTKLICETPYESYAVRVLMNGVEP